MGKNAGRVDCQLAYSYNGTHWNRTFRKPFIPNREQGEYGWGGVYPSSMIIAPDDSIRIYGSGSIYEHHQNGRAIREGIAPSKLLSYRLRKDGFIGLRTIKERGELITKNLSIKGNTLSLNVKAPRGVVRVQVADMEGKPLPGYSYKECEPFTGDDVSWKPRWKAHLDLSGLEDRGRTRIGVRIERGELYAIRVNCFLYYGCNKPVRHF